MRLLFYLTTILAAIDVSLAAPSPPTPAEKRGLHNFVIGPDHPLMLTRRGPALADTATNYNKDFTTGGIVNFLPGNGEFNVTWNTTDDFVVGVGWNPGSTLPITHSGNFVVTSGLAILSVYGWRTDPLVEYYIMEDSVGFPPSGTKKGTVITDGTEYTIYQVPQVNQPSIIGTVTFNQYISLSPKPHVNGTVTIENRFNAWKVTGLELGTLNFQIVAIESWNGSGCAWQKVFN